MRPDAKSGLAALDALGVGQVMLTGDNAATAEAVGRRPVSYTHLRAHETVLDLVCRLLLEKKHNRKKTKKKKIHKTHTITTT